MVEQAPPTLGAGRAEKKNIPFTSEQTFGKPPRVSHGEKFGDTANISIFLPVSVGDLAARADSSLAPITVGNREMTTYIGKRHRVIFTPFELPKNPDTDSTIECEAKHAVVAEENGTSVESVSAEPEGNALGVTRLARADAVAAAAHFGKGDGHDRRIVRMLRVSEQAAYRAARGIINKSREKIGAVMALLRKKRTITGAEVRHEMSKVERKRKTVNVTVEDLQTGKNHKEEVFASNGIVVFDASLTRHELALAA
jgi:hypothetical protein